MNWYIGQEIVCIHSFTNAGLVKGEIYKIKGLMNGVCPCAKVLIDVGFLIPADTVAGCPRHRAEISVGKIWWFGDIMFAPLADISELKEILEKQPETEKV